MKEFFINYVKLKRESLGEVSPEEFEPGEKDPSPTELDDDEDEKPDTKEVPQHIKFTEQVCFVCKCMA